MLSFYLLLQLARRLTSANNIHILIYLISILSKKVDFSFLLRYNFKDI